MRCVYIDAECVNSQYSCCEAADSLVWQEWRSDRNGCGNSPSFGFTSSDGWLWKRILKVDLSNSSSSSSSSPSSSVYFGSIFGAVWREGEGGRRERVDPVIQWHTTGAVKYSGLLQQYSQNKTALSEYRPLPSKTNHRKNTEVMMTWQFIISTNNKTRLSDRWLVTFHLQCRRARTRYFKHDRLCFSLLLWSEMICIFYIIILLFYFRVERVYVKIYTSCMCVCGRGCFVILWRCNAWVFFLSRSK